MNAYVERSTERKQTIAELWVVSRAFGVVANNVNPLARFAISEDQFLAEAEAVVSEYCELSARIDETIGRLRVA